MDEPNVWYLIRDSMIDKFYVVGRSTHESLSPIVHSMEKVKEGTDYTAMCKESRLLNKLSARIEG